MSQSPAGWYPQDDGRQRYWDGQTWTEHFAPGQVQQVGVAFADSNEQPYAGQSAPHPAAPAGVVTAGKPARAWFRKKRVLIPTGLLALVVVGSALSGGDDGTSPATGTSTAAPAPAAEQDAGQDGAAEPVAEEQVSPTAKAAATSAATPDAEPAKKSGIGTTVKDGKFAFTVRGVKCGLESVGDNEFLTQEAQGQYCQVALTVENIGDEAQSMFADNQVAFDDQGRKFSADSMASIADDSSSVLWQEINPGNSVQGNVYFDVPEGTTLAELELHDSLFSDGKTVSLK